MALQCISYRSQQLGMRSYFAGIIECCAWSNTSAIDCLHIIALSIFLSVCSSSGIRLTQRRWQTMLRILELRQPLGPPPPPLLLLLLLPLSPPRDAINTSRSRTRHAPGRQTGRAGTPITGSLRQTSSHEHTTPFSTRASLHAAGRRVLNNLPFYVRWDIGYVHFKRELKTWKLIDDDASRLLAYLCLRNTLTCLLTYTKGGSGWRRRYSTETRFTLTFGS